MADGYAARPVSGEIMTSAPADAMMPRLAAEADVVDADFEVVLPSEQRRAVSEPDSASAASKPALAGGMEMLRRDRQRQRGAFRPFANRAGPAFWSFGFGLAFAAFWVSGGHVLVRQLPFPGAAQAAPAFSIAGVTSRIDTASGRPVLFVDGEASNGGTLAGLLPALEIRVTGEDGRATFYKLGTSQTPLAPGGRFAFSSRLSVPKNGVKTVTVAFGE
ncbi:hypothetical protein [Mesorhizobium sp. KR1-2]|uniref:hypothetical protein n=1 Tax=Mesorhizobium sp. KR1-2 TaxID=3156609 RepID=UPI0032B5B7BA